MQKGNEDIRMSWNEVKRAAQNRVRWKAAVKALCSGRSEEEQVKLNMIKIPVGRRQTSWPFYKCSRRVELGSTVKQLQLVVRAGLELRISSPAPQPVDHVTSEIKSFGWRFEYSSIMLAYLAVQIKQVGIVISSICFTVWYQFTRVLTHEMSLWNFSKTTHSPT